MEIIRIKCPDCGAVLKVENNPGNAGKMLTCPVCKNRDSFVNFKVVRNEPVSDETSINRFLVNTPGKIIDLRTGKEYPLSEGVNILGRKVAGTVTKASVPVETDDLGMSREHASVDVMAGRDGMYHTYISNLNNKNATFINSVELKRGDKIALQDGDIISTSRTRIRYESGRSARLKDD